MEIEGKLIIADPGVYWLLQTIEYAAGYSLATQRVEEHLDTYLDTSYRRIYAAGYSCRRREMRSGILISLASINPTEELIIHRQVLKMELPVKLPPRKWPDCPTKQQILQIIGHEPLLPILEIQQTRIVRRMMMGNQSVAEINLDRVSMVVGDREHIYLDLEIALLPGISTDILPGITTYFRDEWNLRAQRYSKLERGMLLLENAVPVDISFSPINRLDAFLPRNI